MNRSAAAKARASPSNEALPAEAQLCAFGVIYSSSTLLAGMLELLFGCDAFHAGLVLSPAGTLRSWRSSSWARCWAVDLTHAG
ncbi:MAG TPA: hypothetical protein VGD78_20805 [Chthoniobacterales bacterium]